MVVAHVTGEQNPPGKAGLAEYRAQLIRDAGDRAHARAASLWQDGQDPGLHAEILNRIDAGAAEAVTHYAGALIDQLVAKKADHLALERRVRNRRVPVGVLALDLLVFLTLVIIADVGAGNGNPTGWRNVILSIGVGFLFLGPVPLIWALVAWVRGPSRKRLTVDSEVFAAESNHLLRDVDNTLEADWISQVIAEAAKEAEHRLDSSFTSTLRFTDPSMLAGLRVRPVETLAFDQIAELLAESDGASIGLCGPRGVGKTTIIRRFCRSTVGSGQQRVIGICVDVPVVYDQRDFIASIYARLIDEVERRIVSGKPWLVSPLRWHAFGWGIAAAGMTAAAAATALAWWRGSLSDTEIAVLAAAGAALVLQSALAWRARARTAGAEADPLLRIREYAASGRLHLSADVALSSSLSGSVALPWAGFTRSGARQVSRGEVSYPDLVRDFQDFVGHLAAAGLHTRIGIDELDKLEPDDARSFLNGLKAIFGLPSTHFLISVSEDAMSDFERRGLPIRDAFDSSLDEVIRIKEMNADQAMTLLSSRGNYNFPLVFGALCYCLSGGLPRELLRAARRIIRNNARSKGSEQFGLLKVLCEQIITQDLEAKSAALWVVARSIDVEQHSARFRSWLAESDANQQSSEQLLYTCREYQGLDPIKVKDMPESKIALEKMASLALEFAGYKYFAATILDFFSKATDQDLRSALRPRTAAGNIDVLSSARTRFADDPRLAWSLVTQFRQAHQINPVLPPLTEGLRLPGHTSAGDATYPRTAVERLESAG